MNGDWIKVMRRAKKAAWAFHDELRSGTTQRVGRSLERTSYVIKPELSEMMDELEGAFFSLKEYGLDRKNPVRELRRSLVIAKGVLISDWIENYLTSKDSIFPFEKYRGTLRELQGVRALKPLQAELRQWMVLANY